MVVRSYGEARRIAYNDIGRAEGQADMLLSIIQALDEAGFESGIEDGEQGEQKIKNLMIESILPNLSEQQRKAFELALENDYYGYPRKIKLIDLAKRMNVSVSTFQFHLAKAEEKLMPFFSKKL
jgi:predicted DNA binding protein